MPGRNSFINTKCETRLTLNILSKNIDGVSRTVLPEPSDVERRSVSFCSLSRTVGRVCLAWKEAEGRSEEVSRDRSTNYVLTDASVVDEDGGIAVGIADCAAQVDEVGKVRDIAFVIVDIRY